MNSLCTEVYYSEEELIPYVLFTTWCSTVWASAERHVLQVQLKSPLLQSETPRLSLKSSSSVFAPQDLWGNWNDETKDATVNEQTEQS